MTISRTENRLGQKANNIKKFSILIFIFLIGCTGIPENVKPVNNFKLEKYLGKWYYIIFELNQEGYQYSLVSGPDKSYLWILGRNPTMKKDIKSALLEKAAEVGFDISQLIFVNHENLPKG